MVGRVPLADAEAPEADAEPEADDLGTATDTWCTVQPEPGPEGYLWCTVAQSASTASWVNAPTANEARVRAQSGEFNYAGMVALFADPLERIEVGANDQLTFEGDIPSGKTFEVFVGQSQAVGCVYVLSGAGSGRYVVDLASPFWCWPSLCGHELGATGVMFRTHWRTAETMTLAVRSIELVTESGPAGAVNALGAASGPGGRCWFAFAWDSGSASWVVPPSSSLAHVRAWAPAEDSAGMGVELGDAPVDLTAYSRIEVDATVPEGVSFEISAVVAEAEAETRGCGWSQTGAGTTTYTADLVDLSGCWGAPHFDLEATSRLELSKPWALDATLEMSVTAVRFVP